MAYDNFDDAWARLLVVYGYQNSSYPTTAAYLDDIQDATTFTQLKTATWWTCYYLMRNFFVHHAGVGEVDILTSPHYAAMYFASQGVEPEPLTFDDILALMLEADPYQVQYFVGLVDAYRQSIWDRPFNKEFFAALGRGFQLWP